MPAGISPLRVLLPCDANVPDVVAFVPKISAPLFRFKTLAKTPPCSEAVTLLSDEEFITSSVPPLIVNVVLLSANPLVTVSVPPDRVNGRDEFRLRTLLLPWLNSTEALERLIMTSSPAVGRPPPQLFGLCQELSPPAPVQVIVAPESWTAIPMNIAAAKCVHATHSVTCDALFSRATNLNLSAIGKFYPEFCPEYWQASCNVKCFHKSGTQLPCAR